MSRKDTIDKVRTSLRFSHRKLDDSINDTIAACLLDLQKDGVANADESNPLILNAIKLYAAAQPEYQDDPARCIAYMDRYNALKASLTYAGDYADDGSN